MVQFGPVELIIMANWDWETQETETKQKRSKDFRKSKQLQEERAGQCLWTSKAMFGFVVEIGEENWGWVPTQEESTFHRKTRMFLELLLLEEDVTLIQYFWTKQEIFILVEAMNTGSLDWGTQQAGTFQRKSITSLQSPVFLVATQRLDFFRLWIGKEECGAVDTTSMCNWD